MGLGWAASARVPGAWKGTGGWRVWGGLRVPGVLGACQMGLRETTSHLSPPYLLTTLLCPGFPGSKGANEWMGAGEPSQDPGTQPPVWVSGGSPALACGLAMALLDASPSPPLAGQLCGGR